MIHAKEREYAKSNGNRGYTALPNSSPCRDTRGGHNGRTR